jgi:hypothetical protein
MRYLHHCAVEYIAMSGGLEIKSYFESNKAIIALQCR